MPTSSDFAYNGYEVCIIVAPDPRGGFEAEWEVRNARARSTHRERVAGAQPFILEIDALQEGTLAAKAYIDSLQEP